jgi:hypothetical protein
MGIPFPAIEPTGCAFTMPRHPVTSAMSESGVEDYRLWGTVAVGGVLELEFTNIKTTRAKEILATFHQSYSGTLPIDLPEVLFAGFTAEDRAFINSVTTDAGLMWYWPVGRETPAPRQSLVYRHRCTLPIRLEARLQSVPAPATPLPTLWVSRLTTPIRENQSNGGALGSIVKGANQTSFQTFWFEAVGGSAVRVVVVKRNPDGSVLWTRWTAVEHGNQYTSRDSWCPKVVALPDGGCIVIVSDSTPVVSFPHTYRLRAWRLAANGNQEWAREFVGRFFGAFKVALNAGEVAIYTASTFLTGGYLNFRPALIRLSTSGSFLGGSEYTIDGTTENLFPGKHDQLIVQTSGTLVLKMLRDILIETSGDGAVVAKAARINPLSGGLAVMPSGGFAGISGPDTIVRIDSDFNVTGAHRHASAMQPGGVFFGPTTLGLAVSGNGVCYHMGDSFGVGEFFGIGIKITAIGNDGTTPTRYGEIAYGTGLSDQPRPSYSAEMGGVNDIDATSMRGLAHIAGTGGGPSACRINAIGFSLELPTSTATNSSPSRTLYTGGCGNTMSLRGWDTVSYENQAAASITRTVPAITVGSVTGTESTGTISMVDASSDLFWQTVRLEEGL